MLPVGNVAGPCLEQLDAGHPDNEQLVAVHASTPSTPRATMRLHHFVDGLVILVIVAGATPAAAAIAVLVQPAATSSTTRARTLTAET